MKALYKNRLCNIVETGSAVTLADDQRQFDVSFDDEGLVIDPTDNQVADADNFAEWHGLDAEAAKELRAMLRGEMASQNQQTTSRDA